MIFESTPPRESTSETPQRNNNGGRRDNSSIMDSKRRGSPPPPRPTVVSSPAVDAASPGGDDGSPYETNSIKFADYFQQSHNPQPALLRESSSVIFDSAGLGSASRRPGPRSGEHLVMQPSLEVAHQSSSVVEPSGAPPLSSSASSPSYAEFGSNATDLRKPMVARRVSAGSMASFGASSPLRHVDVGNDAQHAIQRDALRQIAAELKERQAQVVQRELACKRREESLSQRENQLEESLARMHQEKIIAAEAAERKAREPDPRQEALERSLQSSDEYRQQLRALHKELSARELEVDSLAQELAAEREKVAAQKMELEVRAASLVAEEDDMGVDFKRHAERIQASSRLVGDRIREIERKEKDLEKVKFEWELKEADLRRRTHEVQAREEVVDSKAKEVQRVLDSARTLELHATQTQRIAERLRGREEALWATAAKVVPQGARAIAAIREDIRNHHQKLEELGAQMPAVLKASAV